MHSRCLTFWKRFGRRDDKGLVAVQGNFLEESVPACGTSATDLQYTKIEAQTALIPSVRMVVAVELVGSDMVVVAAVGMVTVVGVVGVAVVGAAAVEAAVDVARVAVRTLVVTCKEHIVHLQWGRSANIQILSLWP